MQIVARGHNILNRVEKAGISAIYFLHRPTRGRRLGTDHRPPQQICAGKVRQGRQAEAGGKLRRTCAPCPVAATDIVRYGLEAGRFGYRSLPPHFKAQFAWDMLTPLWQTVGRGIPRRVSVFIGFVDYAFAPLSFDGNESGDTPKFQRAGAEPAPA